MLDNTSQTNTTDSDIMAILDCQSDDTAYQLLEVDTTDLNSLF